MGDILGDISDCNLPQVSWVIPDGTWSDHPGLDPAAPGDAGPSWVAAIVNAIGGTNIFSCTDESSTKYWSGSEPTLILVTWDDWGGWYDHVVPWLRSSNESGGYANKGTPDAADGDYYVYGFRVPLLVVSAYNNQCTAPACNGYPGYISGPTVDGEESNMKPPYIHDFGSILGFIEWNFGLPPYPAVEDVNTCGIAGALSETGCQYEFADYFAPDGEWECSNSPYCGDSYQGYPLQDFFNFSLSTLNAFTEITNAKYPAYCFYGTYMTSSDCFNSGFYATDPDDDVSEADE
jgi:hypothetical protein